MELRWEDRPTGSSSSSIGLTMGLLLALSACATAPPAAQAPLAVADPSTVIVPAAAAPSPAPVPPAVRENRTFTMVDGVPQYRIGAGDLVEIILARGVTQDRLTQTVRADGRIPVLFVEITIGGLTPEQAAREIEEALSDYYRVPRVEVLVKEFNSKKVTVLGATSAVGRGAGVYPLRGKTSLTELLASVGGAASDADLEHVRVSRESGQVLSVNLFAVVADGGLSRDLVLDAGDVVFVPTRPPGAERKVFVFGEVRKPGIVPYRVDMTLAEVVAEAGGLTDLAADETRIIRGNIREGPTILTADVDALVRRGDLRQDVPVRPRDIVIVTRSGIGDWNAFLAKLRPTLEFITLGLQPVIVYETIKD